MKGSLAKTYSETPLTPWSALPFSWLYSVARDERKFVVLQIVGKCGNVAELETSH